MPGTGTRTPTLYMHRMKRVHASFFTQLRHLRHFVHAVRHVLFLGGSGFFSVGEKFLHFAAGGKNLVLGRLAEAEGFDADGAGHFAFAQDLHEGALDETAAVDVFQRDFLLIGEAASRRSRLMTS